MTRTVDVPKASASPSYVFRVNRDLVVLNDVNSGNVWLVNQNMQLVNNWDDVVPPKNQSDDQDQESADNNTINILPDRTKPNRPPETKPDAVGVRPGRTTILSVLDNDSDPDGDVLTASVGGNGPTSGSLENIYGGTAFQITVPADAKPGTETFGYNAADGRGLSAAGSITLNVVGPGREQTAAVQARRAHHHARGAGQDRQPEHPHRLDRPRRRRPRADGRQGRQRTGPGQGPPRRPADLPGLRRRTGQEIRHRHRLGRPRHHHRQSGGQRPAAGRPAAGGQRRPRHRRRRPGPGDRAAEERCRPQRRRPAPRPGGGRRHRPAGPRDRRRDLHVPQQHPGPGLPDLHRQQRPAKQPGPDPGGRRIRQGRRQPGGRARRRPHAGRRKRAPGSAGQRLGPVRAACWCCSPSSSRKTRPRRSA